MIEDLMLRTTETKIRPKDLPMRTFAELAPVLLEGESGATYASILAQVTAAIGPKDIIDEFCVRDVADLEWEALRLHRLKANLLNSSLAAGLVKLIEPL